MKSFGSNLGSKWLSVPYPLRNANLHQPHKATWRSGYAAVCKTERFSFAIKRNSEKTANFSLNSINRLDRVSEYRRERMAAETMWPTGWTKTIAGGEFVSLLVEIADEGGRPSR
jgi:hypothetical protein